MNNCEQMVLIVNFEQVIFYPHYTSNLIYGREFVADVGLDENEVSVGFELDLDWIVGFTREGGAGR